ncbi:GPW/gp25 family protein [Epibacterium ulvae]|uniref:GPW/gp25 family protein n=1 Tax=Epibacterium ulvae TaxID=1156985 RepID=UPI0024914DC4|nr:GPW/gp25 family protein [Epibacterium ulvae]
MGLDRNTGRKIEGQDHLGQSIFDILSTPKGTVTMLREYGSDLPDLLGRPINDETMIDVFQAVAEALDRWEPRISVARINIVSAGPGFVELELLDSNENALPLPVLREVAA